MRFSDVHGQERAISLLRRSLHAARLHHAYLFEGPEGVGKELAALALAARLLCENESLAPDADACGACRACRALAGGSHPDYHLIDRGLHRQHPDRAVRSSKGLYLVVDVVRHFLIEPAGLTPALGRRRVFVIRDAERMNEEAQNALLKTLEEPPGPSCLILVSSSAMRLLPTIRSRCQPIRFDLLPRAFVREQLARCSVPATDAELLAELSQGRLGAALRWHAGGLLATRSAVDQVLAAGPPFDPESFAKALVEAASALAGRLASAAEDATRAGTIATEADDETAVEPGDDSDESDNYDEAERRSGARRGRSGKAISTDQLRDALRLMLMLASSLLRRALLHASDAASESPGAADASLRALRPLGAIALAESIEACAATERILDRNVAAQLALERLAVALNGVPLASV